MKVLLVCNSDDSGGGDAYLVHLARGLAKRGHHVMAAVPPESFLHQQLSPDPEIRSIYGLEIGPKLGLKSALDLALSWHRYRGALARLLRQVRDFEGVDVVHFQYKKEQLLGTPVAHALGIPVVWTEHGEIPPPMRAFPPAMMLYRRTARIPRDVICVSEFVAQDIESAGVDPGKFTVIRNGISLHSPVVPRSREAVRGELGIAPDAPLVGVVCRLVEFKKVDVFLHAAAGIAAGNPAARFLVVGEGPERASLERLATDLGIRDKVTFAGYRPDVLNILPAIDVFVSASRTEGLPLAFLEAMREGLPLVATAVGGVPELVQHGVTGFLVPAGDSREIADRVLELLRDDRLRHRFSAAARQHIEQHYDIERVLDRSERVFVGASRCD